MTGLLIQNNTQSQSPPLSQSLICIDNRINLGILIPVTVWGSLRGVNWPKKWRVSVRLSRRLSPYRVYPKLGRNIFGDNAKKCKYIWGSKRGTHAAYWQRMWIPAHMHDKNPYVLKFCTRPRSSDAPKRGGRAGVVAEGDAVLPETPPQRQLRDYLSRYFRESLMRFLCQTRFSNML